MVQVSATPIASRSSSLYRLRIARPDGQSTHTSASETGTTSPDGGPGERLPASNRRVDSNTTATLSHLIRGDRRDEKHNTQRHLHVAVLHYVKAAVGSKTGPYGGRIFRGQRRRERRVRPSTALRRRFWRAFHLPSALGPSSPGKTARTASRRVKSARAYNIHTRRSSGVN